MRSSSPPIPSSRSAAVSCPRPRRWKRPSTCLHLLSGRTHRVFTAVVDADRRWRHAPPPGRDTSPLQALSSREIESYLASAEWRDKAGGYAIQGIAGAFVVKLVGSYSAVVGLPLNETVGLLSGEGYPVHFNWLNQTTLTAV